MESKPSVNSKMLFHESKLLWRRQNLRVLITVTIILFTFMVYYHNNRSVLLISTQQENVYEQPLATSYVPKIQSTSVLYSDQSETKSKIPTQAAPPLKSTETQNVPSESPPTANSTHDSSSFLFPRAIQCKMFNCFNHLRCPITGGCPIYIYDLDILYPIANNLMTTSLRKMLSANNLITTDPRKACLFVALVGEYSYNGSAESKVSPKSDESVINQLSFWRRVGRNHVLINLDQTSFTEDSREAILAQTTFTHNLFRQGFDVVIPPVFAPISGDVWSQVPPIAPPRRRYLLSFQGQRSSEINSTILNSVIKFLYKMKKILPRQYSYIQFQCDHVDKLFHLSIPDWALCDIRETRIKLLRKSTFALIMTPTDTSYVSTYLLQTRLFEALQSGAIPVILGGDSIRLPYEEVLDWRKAVICLSIYQVTGLHLFLNTMSYEDILAFRNQGRMLWERYLGSMQAILDTLLGVIRYRLNIPPPAVPSVSASMYEYANSNMTTKNVWRMPSKSFRRNFTVGLLNGYEQWNVWGDPFALFPQLPWDPIMTPEPRFVDAAINKHFHKTCIDLAGDYPVEQFTVVILNYKRPIMLSRALNMLSRMPYLNKIIVVCNQPRKPPVYNWPETGIPIVVVRGKRNSLNNRFLPYHLIETEAVFCVDDDAVPERKDVYFAFKVWREHRSQIVGFFGRNYEWKKNKGFIYSTRYRMINRTTDDSVLCEVSMILTGAAFIHRYYLWAYWRVLPEAVRSFVDEHMNCEDIAMNFLISHITKKPPVKVDSLWADKLHGKKMPYRKLSNDKYHYEERNKCMQFFTKVMGYNPLLTTHYRVMSFPKMPIDEQT